MRKAIEKMEKKDLIEEARRYVDNAHKMLKDNENYDPDTRCYDDKNMSVQPVITCGML